MEKHVKLKMDNVDLPTNITNDIFRHGVLFSNTVRALIVGPSGCDQTNLIYTLPINEN